MRGIYEDNESFEALIRVTTSLRNIRDMCRSEDGKLFDDTRVKVVGEVGATRTNTEIGPRVLGPMGNMNGDGFRLQVI